MRNGQWLSREDAGTRVTYTSFDAGVVAHPVAMAKCTAMISLQWKQEEDLNTVNLI